MKTVLRNISTIRSGKRSYNTCALLDIYFHKGNFISITKCVGYNIWNSYIVKAVFQHWDLFTCTMNELIDEIFVTNIYQLTGRHSVVVEQFICNCKQNK